MIAVHADISRERAANASYTPKEQFIYSKAFDSLRIYAPKNTELPTCIYVGITGYFDGSDRVETRTMHVYPRNTYNLLLHGATDHLVIKYKEQKDCPGKGIHLWIDSEFIQINPCKENGILVVKLQDQAERTHQAEYDALCQMSRWLTEEQRETSVNMSRVNRVFLVGQGYHIDQVSQCRYEVYALPHRNGESVGPGMCSGALVPRYAL